MKEKPVSMLDDFICFNGVLFQYEYKKRQKLTCEK